MLRHANNFRRRATPANLVLWGLLALLGPGSVFAVQNVTLTWNPSPDTNAAAYKIYYGGVSQNYTNTIMVGNVTNATISGLVDGGTYYFAATTLDSAGVESDFSNEASFVAPLPVNQPPTLNSMANLTVLENSGPQTVALAGITSGSPTENQTLTVVAASSNPALIPVPTVNYTSPNTNGTLLFTPVLNAVGTTTITVTINDGGDTNNLVTQSFTVTVAPSPTVNQPPTLNAIGNLVLNQNAAAQTITLTGITSGSPTEKQTLRVTASSSNPGIVSASAIRYTSPATTASLTVRPTANAAGVATITVTVNDGGQSNNIVSQSFTVTVLPNQPPTLDAIGNLALNENAAAQTITLTGITSGSPTEKQTLKVTASSSNPRLVPAPTIRYTSPASTAQLSFKPAVNATGVATISVTVNDGGGNNNLIRQSFTVAVTAPLATTNIVANVVSVTKALTQAQPAATVNPAATLTAVASASGGFSFQVTGIAGSQYIVQATSDLVHWTSVQTNTAPFTFQDDNANGFSQRFYRAYYQP